MKILKPSHREKKRYLLISGKDANKKTIDETILEFIGVLGYSEACVQTIKERTSSIIISINKNTLNKIRASFLISGKDLKIIKVSGSLKKLKN
jgi:RNase P/RNase MRP subunit POP5